MSLTLATLIPGIVLVVLGLIFLSNHAAVVTSVKRLPRSQSAAMVFFGAGAAWFLYRIWHLSEADFGQYRVHLFVFFLIIGISAFRYVPDFLAVRGLAILMLLAATPLLDAAYMEYEEPNRLFMVSAVFVGIALAIYLGAAPFRLREFFEWLYRRPGRSRVLGGVLAAYGVLLSVLAFSY